MYDFLLKNGSVVDGSGRERRNVDVAVKNGTIAKLGKIDGKEAKKLIDCTGKCVAPGFIDYHSHSDLDVLMEPDGWNILEQGITTEIA